MQMKNNKQAYRDKMRLYMREKRKKDKEKALWRYVIEKEVFSEKDYQYIAEYAIKQHKRLEVYERLTELTRKKIALRVKKWYEPWMIAIDLNIEVWLLKKYLKQKNARQIIDWKKYCIWCDKYKNITFFQHTWKRIATRCKDCNNEIRRIRRREDANWRQRQIEIQKKSVAKTWYKRKSRLELDKETLLREREIQNKSTRKKRSKELQDKAIKNRLLTINEQLC